MSQSILSVDLDEDLLEQSTEVLKQLGLDLDSAVTLLFEEVVATGKLPFEIPGETTEAPKSNQ